MKDYTQILLDLGLTVLQAKTLSALNSKSYETARNISKKISVARQQIYRVLPDLQELGLMEKKIGVPNTYRALPAKEVIKILLERRKQETTEIVEKASILIAGKTENKLIENKQNDFEIKMVTGTENISKNLRHLIEAADKICYVGTPKTWSVQADKRLQMGRVRVKKEVDFRLILGPPPQKFFQKIIKHSKVRIVPYEIPMYVGLFDNKNVAFSIFPKKNTFEPKEFSLLITNYPCIAEMIKIYFDTLWAIAKDYK